MRQSLIEKIIAVKDNDSINSHKQLTLITHQFMGKYYIEFFKDEATFQNFVTIHLRGGHP